MKKTILIAAVMFFALSVSAFAQASFTVASEVVDRAACCGVAERVGAIQFTVIPSSPSSVTGSFTLRYSLPITNLGATLPQGVVITTTASGVSTSVAALGITGDTLVVVPVRAGLVTGDTIRVSNVRVNVSAAASCGTTSNAASANASSIGNFLTSGETAVTVLNGVAQPLLKPTVTAVSVNGAAASTPSNAVINVKEGFLNAFALTTGTDINQTVSKLIRLTITGLPAGVTLTFPVAETSGLFTLSDSAGALLSSAQSVTSASPGPVFYRLTTDSNPALEETFSVSVGITTSGPFPLAPSTVSVSAQMGPISTLATVFPRYSGDALCETASTAFITVSGVLNTVLMIPFASTEVGFNTGIAIANTTLDPGTVAMGQFLQAIPQPGKLTFYFFPKDGSTIAPWVSTDAANVGKFGTDSTGRLLPGRSFVCLLSQLLPSTVTSFGGYIFVVTEFTNGHGEYFLSDFDNFTHGALMLVVSGTGLAGRTAETGLNN